VVRVVWELVTAASPDCWGSGPAQMAGLIWLCLRGPSFRLPPAGVFGTVPRIRATPPKRRPVKARPRRPQGWPIRADDTSGDTSGCDGSVTTITPLTTMGEIRASTKRIFVIVALREARRRSSCSMGHLLSANFGSRRAIVGYPTEIEHEGLHTLRSLQVRPAVERLA